MFHYSQFPSQSSVNPNDLVYEPVESAIDCASKCDNQVDKLHCRSFNYCPDSKKCCLSDRHLIDSSETISQDLVCTHYSSLSWKIRSFSKLKLNLALFLGNYLSDFILTSTDEIELDAELVYDSATPELCAILCTTADNFNCKSFNFCPESKKCLLNSELLQKPPSQDVQRDTCSNYRSIF